MDWMLAHRIAGMAAVQAHQDLEIDRSTYVPVYRALQAASLVGLARPMDRLFGMYFAPGKGQRAGVLLNATLPVITQRHTAAHELGHHRQHHSSAADTDLDRSAVWGDGSWPDHEKVAEAFAAWFLMPMPAVKAALQRITGGHQITPAHVYLVARALGTSYAGTVRHLQNLKLINRGTTERWASIPPSKLKKELTGGRPVPGESQVHVIVPSTVDQVFHVEVGDVLVLYILGAEFEASPVLAPWTASSDQRQAAAVTVTDALLARATIGVEVAGSNEILQVQLSRESARHGADDLWS